MTTQQRACDFKAAAAAAGSSQRGRFHIFRGSFTSPQVSVYLTSTSTGASCRACVCVRVECSPVCLCVGSSTSPPLFVSPPPSFL